MMTVTIVLERILVTQLLVEHFRYLLQQNSANMRDSSGDTAPTLPKLTRNYYIPYETVTLPM